MISPDDNRQRRIRVCRRLIRERDSVGKLLGKALCPNPRWDILLDLFLAELEGRSFYQSCLAPGAPPANSHRHSARLVQLGAIERSLDLADQRRLNVTLTADLSAAMTTLVDAVASHWEDAP